MSLGKIAAQCCHAAVMLTAAGLVTDSEQLRRLDLWLGEGQTKVTIGVNSLVELEEAAAACREKGLNHYLVHDAGRTELFPGTATVLGIGPDIEEEVDAITGSLSLL